MHILHANYYIGILIHNNMFNVPTGLGLKANISSMRTYSVESCGHALTCSIRDSNLSPYSGLGSSNRSQWLILLSPWVVSMYLFSFFRNVSASLTPIRAANWSNQVNSVNKMRFIWITEFMLLETYLCKRKNILAS